MITEEGRTISEVSRSLDVSEPALRRWVTAAKPEGSENSRMEELEQELRKLKKENDDLKIRYLC